MINDIAQKMLEKKSINAEIARQKAEKENTLTEIEDRR